MRRKVNTVIVVAGLAVGAAGLAACGSSSKSTPSDQPGVSTQGTPTTVPATAAPPTTAAPRTTMAPDTTPSGDTYGYG